MTIKILVTGGTFDKEYNEKDGSLFFGKTHVFEMLNAGRSKVDVSVRTVMLIDSLDMTETDREIIADYCKDSEEKHIVITHGTDTMVETAKVLANHSELKGKTIVLTGAMVPFAFGSSDGQFNLGAAISFCQTLSAGVYIAMNGRHFRHDNVRKNKELGIFEPIKGL
ncbi:asparaginase [Candidatus Peregrinibacteria bacterium]|nr:asparaginase [Candidatus Peregrinibacteria bacterium]